MRKIFSLLCLLAVSQISFGYALGNDICRPGFSMAAGPAKTWTGTTSGDWNTSSNWSPAGVPVFSDNVIIVSASNQPVINNSGMACNDLSLNSGTITINPACDLTIYGGLFMSDNTLFQNRGTVNLKNQLLNQNTSPASFDTGTFVLSGTVTQAISGQCIFGKLTINNSTGVILGTDIQINGLFTLTSGLVTLGSFNLILGPASRIAGIPSASAMVVAAGSGQLRKIFTSADSFFYPVGSYDSIALYSPVSLSFKNGIFGSGAWAGVNLFHGKYPSSNINTNYLNRYWSVYSGGITGYSCNAVFKYLRSDVVGSDSLIICSRFSPDPVTDYSKADTAHHYLMANGITSFGTFTGTMPDYKNLNLTLYLEGLYIGGNTMSPAMDDTGPHWGYDIADHITVELHDTSNYNIIYYKVNDVALNTNGSATVPVLVWYNSKYYITIKHRNSLETVSSVKVFFTGRANISYNFSSSASKAYGNNLKSIGGVYVIFSGDITSTGIGYPSAPAQDGVIDIEDLYYIFPSYLNGDTGYLNSDLNGDGVVDIFDEYIAFDNYLMGAYAITP